MEIKDADTFGIKAKITDIEFNRIMEHMKKPIQESHEHMKQGLAQPIEGLQYFNGEGYFVKDYVIEINNQRIKGKKTLLD